MLHCTAMDITCSAHMGIFHSHTCRKVSILVAGQCTVSIWWYTHYSWEHARCWGLSYKCLLNILVAVHSLCFSLRDTGTCNLPEGAKSCSLKRSGCGGTDLIITPILGSADWYGLSSYKGLPCLCDTSVPPSYWIGFFQWRTVPWHTLFWEKPWSSI